MELARRILDELMGPERNKMPNEKGSFGVKFSDPDVRSALEKKLVFTIVGLQICVSRVLPV